MKEQDSLYRRGCTRKDETTHYLTCQGHNCRVLCTRARGANGAGVRRRTCSAGRQTTRKHDSLFRRGCTRKDETTHYLTCQGHNCRVLRTRASGANGAGVRRRTRSAESGRR